MSIGRIRIETFRRKGNIPTAVVSEILAPVWRRVVSRRVVEEATEPMAWRKGLLLGANHIGDMLYCSRGLLALKEALPNCRWDVCAFGPAAEGVESHPAIRRCFPLLVKLPRAFLKQRSVLADLQRERYDVACCYDSGGYWPGQIIAAALGIPNRVGYVHKGLSALVNHPIAIDYPQPYPAYFSDLVHQLVPAHPFDRKELRPVVFPTGDDEQEASEFLRRHGVSERDRLVAVFASTRQPSSLWPREHLVRLLELFDEHRIGRIILGGGKDDRPLMDSMAQAAGVDCIVAAGSLSVRGTYCMLKRCAAVLTPDSGPRHLANAANVPTFFFRNLRSEKIVTGTYCSTEVDLVKADREELGARARRRVLHEISPESVFEKMTSRLDV